MLNQETKRNINLLRDILVGKVPDPKSQVEQIMIALIYKFMNDMDRESVEELGGEPTFFVNEYKEFSWDNLFSPRVSGNEMVEIYTKGVSSLETNPNIPNLFRSIFKDALIPYKDPETLRLFLTQINKFDYSKDYEQLGDGFEYLLSLLSAQGDAGQFRTPRHLIDFLVEVVNPKKNETILDPASGTSGFLIAAFKHIIKLNSENDSGDLLTSTDREKIMSNISGYDISPDMVKIGLSNMYLHGFPEPNIFEYDTLTSDEKWNQYFDVFLANPPFMTPTGGIKPHNKFKNKSSRAEVLFLDYMLLHMKPKGRMGVIVPESIMFQNNSKYRELRKDLINAGLYAVVSLPQGVFLPYAEVKTSIIFTDKTLQKDEILFSFVENDGYSLTDSRSKIEKDDLPAIKKDINNFKNKNYTFNKSKIIKKEEILNNEEISLNPKAYKKQVINSDYEIVIMNELLEEVKDRNVEQKYEVSSVTNDDGLVNPDTKFSHQVASKDTSKYKLVKQNNFVYNPSRINVGSITINRESKTVCVSPMYVVFKVKDEKMILSDFLYIFLTSKKFINSLSEYTSGSVRQTLKFKDLAKIKIPLPPIDKQQGIIEEVENYKKTIQKNISEINDMESQISSVINNIYN